MTTTFVHPDSQAAKEGSNLARHTNRHPYSLYVAAAFAFLFDQQGRVLLLGEHDEDRKYMWDLPGGTLTDQEKPIIGLHREIFEETGLEIELLSPFCWLKWDRHDSGNPILVAFYMARAVGTEVSLSEEHQSYRWVSIAEFRKENLTVSADTEIVELFFNRYLDEQLL